MFFKENDLNKKKVKAMQYSIFRKQEIRLFNNKSKLHSIVLIEICQFIKKDSSLVSKIAFFSNRISMKNKIM